VSSDSTAEQYMYRDPPSPLRLLRGYSVAGTVGRRIGYDVTGSLRRAQYSYRSREEKSTSGIDDNW